MELSISSVRLYNQKSKLPQKRAFVRIAGIAIALLGIGALTACHHPSPEARVDHMASKVASKLDFSSEQKKLLDEIANEIKKDMQAEKEIRLSMHGDFKNWINSSELDKSKIKSLIKARIERFDGNLDKYIEKFAALHKTLNTDQKKEILDLAERFSSNQ